MIPLCDCSIINNNYASGQLGAGDNKAEFMAGAPSNGRQLPITTPSRSINDVVKHRHRVPISSTDFSMGK